MRPYSHTTISEWRMWQENADMHTPDGRTAVLTASLSGVSMIADRPALRTMPQHQVCTISDREWDAYVSGHPDATGYHLARWRHVFSKAFGHSARYLAVKRGGWVEGILPI